ncbi:MAG: hypothetical protein JEZ11_27925, partial [Desulfobacterales bacterium]|nr:hypothetical protein [Desulfobacterales bacterium]
MTEVSNALGSLSQTLRQGFSGIGNAAVQGENMALKRDQAAFEQGVFTKYEEPVLRERV